MVTSGAQQAISLALQAFVHPGDVVLGEEFTWPGLIDGVHHLGARFQSVRMDEHGLDIEDLEAKVARFRPALITLNPQHHNPTCTRLPPERVASIARIAREYRVPVSEDRVAASIAFDHRQLPEIATYETHGHAVTIDSVCKIAWPGLRLGWVRADPQIINLLRPYKAVNDMFSSALSQAAAVSVLDRFDAVTSARIEQLNRRCDLVVDLLRRDLADWSFVRPRGGLSIWVTLPEGTSADAFVQHAGRAGVLVASARQFGTADADSRHLRVPFTAADDVLEAGLHRLARAWGTFDQTTSPAPHAVM
jgi:DNA-binding transcriptional MocR family regulator